MQKKSALLCPFFRMFPSHCIPEAMENLDIYVFAYSTPFWNKFIADKILSIKENLQHNLAFALVQVQFLFLRG
jgi:hypothetical protein